MGHMCVLSAVSWSFSSSSFSLVNASSRRRPCFGDTRKMCLFIVHATFSLLCLVRRMDGRTDGLGGERVICVVHYSAQATKNVSTQRTIRNICGCGFGFVATNSNSSIGVDGQLLVASTLSCCWITYRLTLSLCSQTHIIARVIQPYSGRKCVNLVNFRSHFYGCRRVWRTNDGFDNMHWISSFDIFCSFRAFRSNIIP